MTDAQLYAPYTHVASLKSKNVRDAFIDALNDVVRAGAAHVAAVKSIVQKLHNASLLLDDIEDSAPKRRGLPAAHIIFGVPLTMNTANLVVFDALGECISMDRSMPRPSGTDVPSAAQVFQEELVLLHRGQGQDIFWRDTNQCPSLDDYRLMVQNKTGGLFRLALRLLALGGGAAAGSADLLLPVADQFGYFFQVLDDMMNLCSGDYHEQKSFCEDLTEGKFSFLTTHSVLAARAKGDERLLRVLRSRPTAVDVKLFCLQLMRDTDTFEQTRQVLRGLAKEIESALCGLAACDEVSEFGSARATGRLITFVHALESLIPEQDVVLQSPRSPVPSVPVGVAFEQALAGSSAAA